MTNETAPFPASLGWHWRVVAWDEVSLAVREVAGGCHFEFMLFLTAEKPFYKQD